MRALAIPAVLLCCGGQTTSTHVENVGNGHAEGVAARGDVLRVVSGDFHSCALLRDKTVRCWGRNRSGELGDGTDIDRQTPVQVKGVSGVIDLTAGASFTCALLESKNVTCWGSGRLLGDAVIHDKLPPTMVPGVADVKEVRAGGYVVCALTTAGSVTCWGLDPKPAGAPSRDAIDVAVAGAHGCARVGSSARCWGEGVWSAPQGDSFADPHLSNVKQITTGDTFACAILEGGTIACWGRNDEGELGTQPDSDNHSVASTVPGVSKAIDIDAGEAHVCAILQGGALVCWGANDEGELGRGTRTIGEQPKPVPNLSVKQVAIGADHVCVIAEDNGVVCWGGNRNGQCGDGTTERRLEPVRVKL